MPNYPDDTIAAIATPSGEGGIGIVRLSGKDAIAVADTIFSSPKGRRLKDAKTHAMLYGFVSDPTSGHKVDEALFTVMKAPTTYTREDVVEINCHGGTLPLQRTLQLLLGQGARLAEPGEFTKRAFLNGRIDLAQAEAVIDVIRSRTEQAEKLALQQLEGGLSEKITGLIDRLTGLCAHLEAHIDFPEDELDVMVKDGMTGSMKTLASELSKLSEGFDEGRLFREGASLAIVGKPNVGKSSLLNALLQKDRAIVTDMPGTTRDVIEDYLNIKGLPVRIMDTAGIRESHDLAEIEGVKRSLRAMEGADIVLAVLDAGRAMDEADAELLEKVKGKKVIFAVNKSDIESPEFHSSTPRLPDSSTSVRVSALTGAGIEALKNAVYALLTRRDTPSDNLAAAETVLVTNLRHKYAIDRALQSLQKAVGTLTGNEPLEIAALFMREALDSLGEITGVVTTDDILDRIFNEFCVGK